jgi:hypothetical protein
MLYFERILKEWLIKKSRALFLEKTRDREYLKTIIEFISVAYLHEGHRKVHREVPL